MREHEWEPTIHHGYDACQACGMLRGKGFCPPVECDGVMPKDVRPTSVAHYAARGAATISRGEHGHVRVIIPVAGGVLDLALTSEDAHETGRELVAIGSR